MSAVKILLAMYGILMVMGGYLGYVKAGSKVSLMTGAIAGVLVLIGIYLSRSNPALGFQIIAAVSGLLTIVFIIRLIKTHTFMPSGMLFTLSLIAFIVSLRQFIQK